jgi:hypothetical protein
MKAGASHLWYVEVRQADYSVELVGRTEHATVVHRRARVLAVLLACAVESDAVYGLSYVVVPAW